MRLQGGETLDSRYELVRRIGSGGMADVWEAHDVQLGRQVALKVLHENFSRDRDFVERFRQEASHAAGMQHPNVVGVFDRGEVEDTYYIAMELIEGPTLRDLIDRGLAVDQAVEVARQVLGAAAFAHGRQLVHRDLKPMNVLIDRSGRVRVTDFGIARAGTSEITRTGSVMGTAQYLSPEQAQGHEVGPRSDLYSVGVMLFEMLTGRVPFDGDNTVAVAMKQVAEQPPAPSTINPEVSPALDAVVLRALAKDPANRFGSAEEMRAALDAALDDPNASHTARFAALAAEPPLAEERKRRRLWAAAIVAAALLIALGAWALASGDGSVGVPEVTEMRQAQASSALREAGFEVDVDPVPSPAREGIVVEQDPRAGTEAEEGSIVTIAVSLGPDPVVIPDVSGDRRPQAVRKLERRDFEVEIERRASEDVRSGRAIRTEPGAGADLEPSASITLVISSGADTATVPDVVGRSRSDAAAALRSAGFVVNQDSEDSDAPEDQVIRQLPDAGTTLAEGDQVTIVYSTGPESEEIVLDDLVGQDRSFAEGQLAAQGLNARVRTRSVDDRSDDGVVLSQSPAANTRLSPGDRVTLVVGEFTESRPGPGPDPSPTPPPDPNQPGGAP